MLDWIKSHKWQVFPWIVAVFTFILLIAAVWGPPENFVQVARYHHDCCN